MAENDIKYCLQNEPRHEKTCLGGGGATSLVSNQSAQLQKLATVSKFCIKQVYVSYYLDSEQQRYWSDCVDAQADLRFVVCIWHKTGFFMTRLKCPKRRLDVMQMVSLHLFGMQEYFMQLLAHAIGSLGELKV